MNLLIFLVVIGIIFVIFSLFSSHYTRVFGYSVLILFDILSLILIINNIKVNIIGINPFPIMKLLLIFICFIIILAYNGIFYLVCSNKTYDFLGKIISFTYIKNSIFEPIKAKNLIKDDTRIIGKVISYTNNQLRYNGRFLAASSIACAGATLISGSMGSGKTFFIESLIKQNILSKKNVIFSEFKGDEKVIKHISDFAKKHNYDIYILQNGKGNFNYDPLKNLNNAGRISAILNMRKWSIDGADNHYKIGTQVLLQHLVGDFKFNENSNVSYTFQFYNYVQHYRYKSDERDVYSTVNNLLKLLVTSTMSPMFSGQYDRTFDFNDYASGKKNSNFIIITSFISSNKDLATSFMSLFIQDIIDVYTNNPVNYNVYLYIDEFATLENPFIVKDLLEKGRSLKLATTLGLQDINQIVIKTNEAYLDSILGTINNFCIFNGATRKTAEKLAGVQLADIEYIIMNLKKPMKKKIGNGFNPPTALYISKYPTLNKRMNTEVFRFIPYIVKENTIIIENSNENDVVETNNYSRYKNNKDEIKNVDEVVEENHENIDDKNVINEENDEINTNLFDDFI